MAIDQSVLTAAYITAREEPLNLALVGASENNSEMETKMTEQLYVVSCPEGWRLSDHTQDWYANLTTAQRVADRLGLTLPGIGESAVKVAVDNETASWAVELNHQLVVAGIASSYRKDE